MRIGIDARVLQTGCKNRGIGVVAHNLIKSLLQFKGSNIDFGFYLFKDEPVPHILNSSECIKLRRYAHYNWFWQQSIGFRDNFDICHFLLSLGPSLEVILPYFQRKKTIATVYDLCIYYLRGDPWCRFISQTKEYRLQIQALKRTTKAISVSNFTKRAITKAFGVSADCIKVVHPGVDTNIFKKKEKGLLNKIKEKYNLPSNFVLAVGDDYKKNLPSLFRTMHLLGVTGSCSYKSLKLVVVGNPTHLSLIGKLNLAGRVMFISDVAQEELVAFYNLATLLAFPSIMEGFGLPVLEAMACECPVVASNRAALPEVVGDAGILVDPYDEKEITNAIQKVIEDKNLQVKLIEKGLNRVPLFSWQNAAEKVLKLYQDLR